MKKLELLRSIDAKGGSNASFVANVILTRMACPARKLRGLLWLIEAGHTVTISLVGWRLLVDGNLRAWVELELDRDLLLHYTAQGGYYDQTTVASK